MAKTSIPIPDDASCLDCGYSFLDLTADRCPECGRAFDADDTSTFMREGLHKTWRRLARPPTLTAVIPSLVFLAYFLNDARLPGTTRFFTDMFVYMAAVVFFLISAVDLLRRAIALLRDAPRAKRDKFRNTRRGLWRFCVPPVCVLTAISVGVINWPLRLSFAAQRGTYEELLEQIENGNPPPVGRIWVGFDPVVVEQWHRETLFLTAVGPHIKAYGFVKGRPGSAFVNVLDDAGGGWYVIECNRVFR
ncbi:MAG: hypothetical protein KDA33_11450 [Phycisphaerales bacterium]|nr:hypothetical protein [Phycisphaerales bacterium]